MSSTQSLQSVSTTSSSTSLSIDHWTNEVVASTPLPHTLLDKKPLLGCHGKSLGAVLIHAHLPVALRQIQGHEAR